MVDTRSAVPLWRRLTPGHLLLIVPWIGLVVGSAKPMSDNSLLWHVRAGALQLKLGQILTSDPFSFTMQGASWRTQSWLAELSYAILERWIGGLRWVPALLVVVGMLTFAMVGIESARRTQSVLVVGVVLSGLTWLALSFEVPRPVLFSYLLLAALVTACERSLRWAVPLIIWIWAGVHGSWVVGVGYVLLDALARKAPIRDTYRTLGISLIGTSLTAHGLAVWDILWTFYKSRDALRLMSEWRIPDLLSFPVLPFTFAGAALLTGLARGKIQRRHLWIVAPFLLFGMSAGRNLMPAGLVLAPWVSASLSGEATPKLVELPERRETLLNLVLAVLLLVAPVSAHFLFRFHLDAERFPVAAATHLDSGPVWHDDAAGGYLIYAEWPDRKVFIDDRAELFGAKMMGQLVRTKAGASDWRDVFARYRIQQALVRSGTGIRSTLRDAGWIVSYTDDNWEIWRSP